MPGNAIIVFCVAAVIIVLLKVLTAWGNKALELTVYRINGRTIPKAFDGFRIAQVSDLHNAEMGKDNEKLISMLRRTKPDIIVITGDMIYCRNQKTEAALGFAEKAVKIAPCYYVTGNHEARVGKYSEFRDGLLGVGVNVLENAETQIDIGGEKITVIGVNDPLFRTDGLSGNSEAVMNDRLSNIIGGKEGYTVLLSHRPELFKTYVKNNVDLVFSGHAHGGQIIIPFIGGLAAPNQGLFPKYYKGIYTEGNTAMVVSRGIGKSIFPFRINNRPEVVLVELCSDSTLTEQ